MLQQFRSLCNIEYALAIVGMLMLWPVLRAPFQFTVMAASSASSAYLHLSYDICLVALGAIMAFLLPVFRYVLTSFRAKAVCSIAAGLLSAVGAGLLLGQAGVDGEIAVATSVGAILLACGVALLFALWSLRLIQMGFDSFCCCITLSFAASFLLGVFDYYGVVLRALCLLLPLGSAGILCCTFLFLDRHFALLELDGVPAGTFNQSEGIGLSRIQVGDYMVLVFLFVGLIASAVVRSLWMHSYSGYSMKPGLVPTYIISIALAISYVVLAFLAKEKGLGMLLGVAFTMATLFVGILLCAIVGQTAGLGAVASSHTSFEFLLWTYLALVAFGHPRLALRGVGCWLIAEGATSILAQLVIPRLLGINANTSDDLSVVIALSSMTLIAISFVGLAIMLLREAVKQKPPAVNVIGDPAFVDAALSVMGEGELASIPPALEVPDAEESGPFDLRLAEELQRVYGLTEREAQVAACAARGNSVKRVADLLFLAPSTVQGYMKSIYRKMGINRKQSLIDIAHSLSSRK